nr:uncharacterized protein LOC106732416 isoform X2 [Pelodiscus sinensis]|eukprot:XP_025043492.1 uncharacterized protein LOC106732416 isoform X2 [Pelodiscus sinensis]
MGNKGSKIDPKTPLGKMLQIYSQPGKLPAGLKLRRLAKLTHEWNEYTYVESELQFPVQGTFQLDKLNYLKGVLESSHPSQMNYWHLWDDQASKLRDKSRMASLKDTNEKLKKQLAEVKEKSDSSKVCPPPYNHIPTPSTPGGLYPCLWKPPALLPDPPEDLLDMWVPNFPAPLPTHPHQHQQILLTNNSAAPAQFECLAHANSSAGAEEGAALAKRTSDTDINPEHTQSPVIPKLSEVSIQLLQRTLAKECPY